MGTVFRVKRRGKMVSFGLDRAFLPAAVGHRSCMVSVDCDVVERLSRTVPVRCDVVGHRSCMAPKNCDVVVAYVHNFPMVCRRVDSCRDEGAGKGSVHRGWEGDTGRI